MPVVMHHIVLVGLANDGPLPEFVVKVCRHSGGLTGTDGLAVSAVPGFGKRYVANQSLTKGSHRFTVNG